MVLETSPANKALSCSCGLVQGELELPGREICSGLSSGPQLLAS